MHQKSCSEGANRASSESVTLPDTCASFLTAKIRCQGMSMQVTLEIVRWIDTCGCLSHEAPKVNSYYLQI